MIEQFENSLEHTLLPPNITLESTTQFSKTPVIYDYLFYIDFNKNGNCILSGSGVDETFWEGTLLYFQNSKQLESLDYHSYYIYATSSDGKFLDEKTIVLADDTGHINVLSLDDDSSLRSLNYFRLSNRVPQLSVWNNSSHILSCSDRSVSIWDAKSVDGKPKEKYENFHWDTVTCLDTLRDNTNLFISGARDRMMCIWDIRHPTPASVLYNNEFSSITSVGWNQQNDNYIVAGTQAGDIYLLDKREPKDFISVLYCFSAPINRIAFKNSKEFAVCGDSNEVLVVNSEENNLDVIYKNEKHNGYVKGLAWYNDNLFSCGFGKSLIQHTL